MNRPPRHPRRRPLRSSLVGAVVVALSLGLSGGCGRDGDAGEPRLLRLDLWRPIDASPDVEWPEDADGVVREVTAIEEPHRVEVEIGQPKPVVADSQLTFVGQRQGELLRVEIQPPADLEPRDATLDALEALLEANGLLDDDAAAELAELRSAGDDDTWPQAAGHSFRTQLDRASMFVQLRRSDDDGWFYTISFSRPVAEWPDR